MTLPIKYPISIAAVFIWVGFICAISFMEAWMKFQAPGITLKLGLGIGRLVFNALNKVEWVLCIVILLELIFNKASFLKILWAYYGIAILILITQSVWLLPGLDMRAEIIIQGNTAPASNLHWYFVGLESIKLICLFTFGVGLLRNFQSLRNSKN